MGDDAAAATVCGACAGAVMTLTGHPFDTTKVRMQTSGGYTSTLHCVRLTVQREGALALYKGLTPALLTMVPTGAIRFSVQNRFNAWLAGWLGEPHRDGFGHLPLRVRVAAEGGGGAVCGLVLPFVLTPMELIKCRRQVLQDNAASNWQIARDVFREHGLRGLYTGHTLTVLRSTVANAAMFASYEFFRGLVYGPAARAADARHFWLDSVAGVLSGWTALIVCYPFDVVKSRVQVTLGAPSAASPSAAKGIGSALAELWRERAMYRGISAMLVRAVPVHVVYLPTYSFLMARFGSGGGGDDGSGGGAGSSRSRLRRRRTSAGESIC